MEVGMEKKKKSLSKQTSSKKKIAEKVEVAKDEPVVTNVKEAKTVTKEAKTKSHDHSLFKVLAILVLITVVLTWIIPSGYFNGADGSANIILIEGEVKHERKFSRFIGIQSLGRGIVCSLRYFADRNGKDNRSPLFLLEVGGKGFL